MSAVLESTIEKTPGVCGGEARIRSTRIPVWLLVAFRQDGATDHFLLESYPSLTPSDLSAAWWYYVENREEIDRVIKQQDEA